MITNVDDVLEYGVFTNATQIKGVPVDDRDISNGKVLAYNTSAHKLEYVENGVGTWGNITGSLSKQTDLKSFLDSKAPTSHTHTIANVTDLQTTLDSKVDEVVGKGLSTNDLTNELKGQYDQTVLDSHKHSNKTLLDGIINTGDGSKYLSNDGTYKTIQGGSGVDTFIELTDTPIGYIGQEGKYVRVNPTANGLEFIEGTGGGVASFTQLNDVPTSYNNGANKFVKVKSDESGLEFVTETIPTKTSELTNDVGFVVDNNYVHTDNNYTTIEQTKLASIQEGAEVNVQSDWNTTDTLGDSYIRNKPTIPTKTSDLVNNSQFVIDSNYVHTDNNYTTTEKNKLSGIQSGAEVNVNADWNSISGDSQILNKPSIINNANTLANPTKEYVIKNNSLVENSGGSGGGGGGAVLSYKFFQEGEITFSSSQPLTFTPNYTAPNKNYIILYDCGNYYTLEYNFFGKYSSATISSNFSLQISFTMPSNVSINADTNFPLVYGSCVDSIGVLHGVTSYNRINRAFVVSMVGNGGLIGGKTSSALLLTNNHHYHGTLNIPKDTLSEWSWT